MIAINEALTKHLFDNRYGTGQSTIDAIMRTTNVLLAGHTSSSAVMAGADAAWPRAAHGMGAHVIVTEVDPTRALEALMDGFRVARLEDACAAGGSCDYGYRRLNVVDDRPHQRC